ncbi:MAG: hypothetical protein ABW124_11420 [Candidatus Thiodiazotropha sp. 6PLUC9]
MFSYLFKFKWIVLLLVLPSGLQAQTIQISEAVPQVKFIDQHGNPHLIGADSRLLIYSHSKNTGSMMAEILADVKTGHMHNIQAAYIADISGMPSLISRFIALPKMRDIPSPILVSREADQVAWIPKKEDKLTLIFTQKGKVSDIIYSNDEEEIRALLKISHSKNDKK